MTQRRLPPTASIAQDSGDGRLFAPSAARNAGAILAVLADRLPAQGRALELAAGTGQHAAHFAAALPGWRWRPSEPDPTRRASIDAYARAAALANVAPAIALDATAPGWGAAHGGQDLVLLVNLLHLISDAEAATLLTEARAALAPGGLLAIYGPFLRGGGTTSEGDARFHASLRASDPMIGYKDAEAVAEHLRALGLDVEDRVVMPANNLFLFARAS
ncbi:DUF938 domain-containing protein [Roseovarius spongiae]|uniref:DUF938 domain-containing protein n=1 Tax=Roseovarius spongiae TaxID=2320272 RepID=A0A3A8B2H1_9RHOB|nr:DUF938 domain-containing protein [Roseovarius spongiae]RKF13795.1 DUF938 domain-containing protein [Roseovarius spongiae]